MKCSFSKIDCHECKINSNCEVYETLMAVPVLWGEAAKKFEEEANMPPTEKDKEILRRATEIYKKIKAKE